MSDYFPIKKPFKNDRFLLPEKKREEKNLLDPVKPTSSLSVAQFLLFLVSLFVFFAATAFFMKAYSSYHTGLKQQRQMEIEFNRVSLFNSMLRELDQANFDEVRRWLAVDYAYAKPNDLLVQIKLPFFSQKEMGGKEKRQELLAEQQRFVIQGNGLNAPMSSSSSENIFLLDNLFLLLATLLLFLLAFWLSRRFINRTGA